MASREWDYSASSLGAIDGYRMEAFMTLTIGSLKSCLSSVEKHIGKSECSRRLALALDDSMRYVARV